MFAEVRERINKSLKFVLVGHKDLLFEDTEIERVLQALNIWDSVIFLSNIPIGDLVSIYNRAQALIFISHGEGFGLPILEAMACGTPVITSNTTACDEIAGDAAMKVEPENLKEAVHALTQVLENETLRRHLREKGLSRAAEFSWARCARETLALYERCVFGQ